MTEKDLEPNFPILTLNYKKQTYEFSGIDYYIADVTNEILLREMLPEQDCCKESKKVGEYSRVISHLGGVGGDILECPTCSRIELTSLWNS